MLLLDPSPARAKIQVEGTVDRSAVAVGDPFTLSVRVTSQNRVKIEEPRLPHLNNFEIINRWNSQQTQSSIGMGGMKTTRTRVFNYNLVSRKSGIQNIDPVEVVVSGKVFRTQPIRLHVHPQGKSPPAVAQPGKRPGQRRGQNPLGLQGQHPFSFFFNQNPPGVQRRNSENAFFSSGGGR